MPTQASQRTRRYPNMWVSQETLSTQSQLTQDQALGGGNGEITILVTEVTVVGVKRMKSWQYMDASESVMSGFGL